MWPTISLGRVTLPSAGLIYILGIYVALVVVERAARRLRLPHVALYSLAANALLAGFVGARLTFVFSHWSAFQDNWLGIVWPLTTGYSVGGGLIVALATAVLYGRARRLAVAPALGALVPGLAVGLLVVSLADLVGGPGLGKLTDVPWALPVHGSLRHPVQLYEMLTQLVALGLWQINVDRGASAEQSGLATLAGLSLGRLLTDAFRANTLLIDGYHTWQILSLLSLLLCLVWLARLNRPVTPTAPPDVDPSN